MDAYLLTLLGSVKANSASRSFAMIFFFWDSLSVGKLYIKQCHNTFQGDAPIPGEVVDSYRHWRRRGWQRSHRWPPLLQVHQQPHVDAAGRVVVVHRGQAAASRPAPPSSGARGRRGGRRRRLRSRAGGGGTASAARSNEATALHSVPRRRQQEVSIQSNPITTLGTRPIRQLNHY